MPHSFALQALSLREQMTHVHGDFDVPNSATRLFVDIEGIPERSLYYLIGVLEVSSNGDERYRHFWADTEAYQPAMFHEFFQFLRRHDEYVLFHYGNYESRALRDYREQSDGSAEEVLGRSVNILSIVYQHLHFPTWSNSLKEIASFLGFKWSRLDATGLQSIVWREQWAAITIQI